MGDVCTGSPTFTSFSASTTESVIVSQSTSESVSVGQESIVTRSVSSGSTWVVTESTIPGSTTTIPVEVPITYTTELVVSVPVTTLFAPCTSSETTSTTPTSRTTPTSTSTSTSDQPESTSSRRTTDRTPESSAANNNSNTANTAATPTPTPTNEGSSSLTGTLITTASVGSTTLPNGSQSVFTAYVTSSLAPNGSLNDNNNSGGGKSGTNTRAVAIGLGVTGGVIALIILIFGITWHIRRKRRNSFDGLEDSDIWAPGGPGYEAKNAATPTATAGGYSYNPYGDSPLPARYAPVPTTGSPPRSRPLSLADPMVAGYPPPPHPAGLTVAAPLLTRAKTADEILYEAAREGLPKSRTSSATASHHTRGSETGLVYRQNASSHMTHGSVSGSHRTHASVTASHMTHASESMKSRRSESVGGGLLHSDPGARGSLGQDAHLAQRYQDLMDAPADIDRPMSPVSVVAPRLAIVNPDLDKDA